ncbi:pilin [Clostridium beijerinckii]|nr:pilin [Clostridium beijerinckii]
MNNLSIRKMNQVSKRKKKGFTLIELIIVIAIIAILAAIAIPKFGAVRENANLASDQANAKIIATAVAQAVSEGEITEDEDTAVDSADYLPYIDGGTEPVAKYKGATSFVVMYDADGTTITLDGGDEDKQVYPAVD